MRGVQGWVIPPAPTTSMCALNMSVPPSPLPWATAITLARPGPSSCNSVSSSTLSSQPATARSEERRVGKECRSLCDWSSDVCSSDLAVTAAVGNSDYVGAAGAELVQLGVKLHALQPAGDGEIGRASCRERV